MDIASSTRAAENRTRWNGIDANSSMVPQRPSKVVGYNRIEIELVKVFITILFLIIQFYQI